MLSLSPAEQYSCELKDNILNSQKISEPAVLLPIDLEACGLICFRNPSQFTPAVSMKFYLTKLK